MRTFYFYSLPNSKEPSPYFFRVPSMLRDLSRKGILRFRLWQGRHEAPVPLSDGPEPVIKGKAPEQKMIRLRVQFYADGFREGYLDLPECVKDLPQDGPYPILESQVSERRRIVMEKIREAFPWANRITIITCKYATELESIMPAAPWPIRTEIGSQP